MNSRALGVFLTVSDHGCRCFSISQNGTRAMSRFNALYANRGAVDTVNYSCIDAPFSGASLSVDQEINILFIP